MLETLPVYPLSEESGLYYNTVWEEIVNERGARG